VYDLQIVSALSAWNAAAAAAFQLKPSFFRSAVRGAAMEP
jgi:hypothetical protein